MLYEGFVDRLLKPVRNVVEPEAVRLFAEAIGDPSPLYSFEVYARRGDETVAPGEVGFLVFDG